MADSQSDKTSLTNLLGASYNKRQAEFVLSPEYEISWVGGMGCGKALHIDTPVLTPNGWKPIGHLRAGDNVIGSNGFPTTVVGVFPQGKRQLYRMTFNDGTSTECDGEHLWATATAKQRHNGKPYTTKTTREIAETLFDAAGNRQHFIPVVAPITFPEKTLPIDPYFLGVLLGDGCLRGASVSLTTADADLAKHVESFIPAGMTVRYDGKYTYRYIGTGGFNPLIRALKDLGVYDHLAQDKFVPQEYLFASLGQRVALLQGLMDTDGTIGKHGRAIFYSTSEKLADAVVFLTQSLGGIARRGIKKTTHLPCHWVSLSLPVGITPCRLQRKAQRYTPPMKYTPARAITSVVPTRVDDAVCIKVDASDGLFVAEHCVVTHNTYALCVAVLRHCLKYPGARALVSRLTFRELIDSTKYMFFELVENKGLREMFSRPTRWDYREGTNLCRLRNGAEIIFANLEPNRLDKLKNLEFSIVGIDQAEEIAFSTYQLLLQRCRLTAVPHTERHVLSIANDEGDNWLRKRFLAFEHPHGKPTKDATRKLIRGSSLENPHLDAGARAQLLTLPPEVQRRWVYAAMDAGSSRLIPDLRTVDPLPIPAHWPRWLGVDPARSTGITCAVWVTVNPDKETYGPIAPNAPHIFAEYWAEGRDAETHAEAINLLTGPHLLRGRVMDRSAWHSSIASRAAGNVNVAQLYINAGLPVMPSEGDEWARVMLFLEAHRRGLTVSRACTHLVAQAPDYRINGQELYRPGLEPARIVSKQKFHAVDAAGYALSILPTKVAPVDLREVTAFFPIAGDIDDGSRLHWQKALAALPKRKGQESVVSLGLDEIEFYANEMNVAEPSQDTLWY